MKKSQDFTHRKGGTEDFRGRVRCDENNIDKRLLWYWDLDCLDKTRNTMAGSVVQERWSEGWSRVRAEGRGHTERKKSWRKIKS